MLNKNVKIFMNKSLVKLVVFFLIIIQSISASAQFYNEIMNKYEDQFPREKIHIHFDKPNYGLGETIYYKLYILEGTDLSSLSKTSTLVGMILVGNFLSRR